MMHMFPFCVFFQPCNVAINRNQPLFPVSPPSTRRGTKLNTVQKARASRLSIQRFMVKMLSRAFVNTKGRASDMLSGNSTGIMAGGLWNN